MAALAAQQRRRNQQQLRLRRASSSPALPLLAATTTLLLLTLTLTPAPAHAANEGSTQQNLDAVLSKYYTNAELAAWADDFASRCASVAKKYAIGKSASGKHDLIVLELSDKPGIKEPEPSFQYVANMHGNEPSGRVLLPALAEYLCANGADPATARDKDAARLLKEAHVHMLLTMNPDGYESRRRENANYADLNRDFPDAVARKVALDGPTPGDGVIFSSPKTPNGKFDFPSASAAMRKPSGNEQPETLAVMKWMLDPPQGSAFTAGANLHEGAIVANYPWDGYADGSEASRGIVRGAPENAAFVRMAKAYSRAHSFMSRSAEFKDGIGERDQRGFFSVLGSHERERVRDLLFAHLFCPSNHTQNTITTNNDHQQQTVNGAQWYPVYGGLQDWGYVAAGTLGITLELSQSKMRPSRDLPSLWRENRAALVALPAAAVLGGARGRVWAAGGGSSSSSNSNKKPLPGAGLSFDAVNRTTTADAAFGFFARPLAPGKHVVRAWAPGYASVEKAFEVPADGSGVWLDLVLEPVAAGGSSSSSSMSSSSSSSDSAATTTTTTTTAATTLRAGGGRRPNSSEPAPWRLKGGGIKEEGEGVDEGAVAAAPGAVSEEEAATTGAGDPAPSPAGSRAASAGALVVLAQAGMIVAVAGAIAVQRRRSVVGVGGGGGGSGIGGSGGAVGMASVGAFRPSRQPPVWRPVPVREDVPV